MGLFQQRKDEEENQWTLPSEPLDRDRTDVLDEAPAVDPMTLGLGLGAGVDVNSIVFPVAPPAPAAFSVENREPESETDETDA
ncbi:hypothetical protein [Microbacterium sp. W4I20]|uniref:hypothetical protein n=1 Tax=Microbacterium sp. W4I20 TaxID=3042262 RepID=UPI002782CE35|nr:hypothetical protein [Microbacterium sp. W4I20]MDQ0727167.1 hypothetical protein [Microbacterium sp. W4I20]